MRLTAGRISGPPPAQPPTRVEGKPGSDFMVDVLMSLGCEYISTNPGSAFDCLHESLINYGGSRAPPAADLHA